MAEADRYEKLKCIGRGSFGDVYEGVDTTTGQPVAIKVINLEDVEDDIQEIRKEVQMLAGCKCKNITEYYGAIMKPGTTELLIVLELMSCSVADLVAHGPLDEASIAYILREVLQALVYLHSENRIHRDIKSANILLSAAGEVKMTDFGVSGQLTGTLGYKRKTFVGTPFWMAPEVIDSSDTGYSERADVWSLGITAIEMATGSPPYADLHPMRVLFMIPKNPPPELEGAYSPALKDFVAACLQKQPTSRPSAKELLSHPLMRAASMPPHLADMVSELAKHRRPITSRRDADENLGIGATMPAWEFGTLGRVSGRTGETLRASMQSTLRGGTLGRIAAAAGLAQVQAEAAGGAAQLPHAGSPSGTSTAPEHAGTVNSSSFVRSSAPGAGIIGAGAASSSRLSTATDVRQSDPGPTGKARAGGGTEGAARLSQSARGELELEADAHTSASASARGSGGGGASAGVEMQRSSVSLGSSVRASLAGTAGPGAGSEHASPQRGGAGLAAEGLNSSSSSSSLPHSPLPGEASDAALGPGSRASSGQPSARAVVRGSDGVGALGASSSTPGASTLNSKAASRYAQPAASSYSQDSSLADDPTSGGGAASASGATTSGYGSGGVAAASGNDDKYGTVQSRLRTTTTAADPLADSGTGTVVARGRGGPSSVGPGTIGPGTMQFGNTFSKRQFDAIKELSRPSPPQLSSVVLSRLLLPSVQHVYSSADRNSQALLSSLLNNLSQLEKLMPGSSTNLLQALLVRLACNTDPELAPLHAAAAGVFAPSDLPLDETPAHAHLATPGAASSSRGSVLANGRTPRPGSARAVPSLGPLGEFLLGKWTEEVAHERALLARMGAL